VLGAYANSTWSFAHENLKGSGKYLRGSGKYLKIVGKSGGNV
jgi:hypothetical protein